MPKNASDTDVIIVGAGPTGLLLANLLGTMGVRTTIIERNAGTVDEPRAVSIDDESMRSLQAAGLSDEVGAICSRGYGSIYKGPNGSVFATVKPFIKEYGFDKRNAFQQPEFEAILRAALERHDNVTAHFETEVTGFSQTSEAVKATVTFPDSESGTVTGSYMVACDGGRSAIRKALDIKMEGTTFEEPWLIVDLLSTQNRCFHTEVHCDPSRPSITLPGPNGVRRYEFKLQKGENPQQVTEETFVRRLLAETGPDAKEPIRRVRVYTFHARIAERWREGRVFLAGDAAHLTPPFAGQGMNSGLRDAHSLAWRLAETLHATGSTDLLDSYQTERKPHAWSLIQLALRMGQVMMPASRLQGSLIRAGFHALALYPPARDYFAQMKYKPKPRFEQGLIQHGVRRNKHSVVGRMIPQPVVADPDRTHHLLDEVLPDRPVVLLYSKAPDTDLSETARAQFRKLGVSIVGLTPECTNPVSADFPIYRDQSRFFASEPYKFHVGHAFLVRRDRYVAASVPVSRADSLTEMILRLSPQLEHAQSSVAEHISRKKETSGPIPRTA
ncbi:3-(3-hydroxy-phenyl)propionate hydroxylase [Labrenzia sp. EL_208]|nr:3-(3-hydroxy-phenyl)propionate hydroxylase [Labrenzia sp. EL_132]MBG6230969.1 3-(3-hydroxy-phenyl)propionate hydroxylase [Labrenzia sp. EL_208]